MGVNRTAQHALLRANVAQVLAAAAIVVAPKGRAPVATIATAVAPAQSAIRHTFFPQANATREHQHQH